MNTGRFPRWLDTACDATGPDIHDGQRPCGKRQIRTTSGDTCEDGHGGAWGREMTAKELALWANRPLPAEFNESPQSLHPDDLTEYSLRLMSGRVVEPGPGGFFWIRHDGRRYGSARSFDWVARELAAGSLGGAHVALSHGRPDGSLEYIPRESIESLIRRPKN